MMTEYVVMHVLRFHRDMPGYQAAQASREWRRTTILRPEQRRVGFLGFGMMAKAPALVLKSLGFKVSAWVRNPRHESDVPINLGRFFSRRHRGLPVTAYEGNRGRLSYAALDALWPEPLPPTSPLWLHPKVTVMPHVARRPTVAPLVTEIAATIRSVEAGGRLLQEVDIMKGY
jgi:glyoxylate/hydroxypyruvate reductase A